MRMSPGIRSLLSVGVIATFLVMSALAFSTNLDGPLHRENLFRHGGGAVGASADTQADRVGTYLGIAGQLWERTKDPQSVRNVLNIALSELDRTQVIGSQKALPPATPSTAPVLPMHLALPPPAADSRSRAAPPERRGADEATRVPRAMTTVLIPSVVIRTRPSATFTAPSPGHTSSTRWRGRLNSWRDHLKDIRGLDRPRNLTLLDAPLE
jgi:hypothetical protein